MSSTRTIALVGVLLIVITSAPSQCAGGEPDRDAMTRRADALLAERWAQEHVRPAPPAGDAEFLRRAYLDLTGVVPPVSAVRSFLEDHAADKRARLIDALLASPAHATHLANTWRHIMLPGGADGGQLGNLAGLEDWLRRRFAENVRYDQIVADLMVAESGGPALFYESLQVQPEALAANTARIFLGVQLGCAQCHDHPFDHWTQQDFWGYAAFFARVRRSTSNPGARGVQLVDVAAGEVSLPGAETTVAPRFLGGQPVEPRDGSTRRDQLALWAVSRDNPYLARAAVNWAWAHLFGRGLVDPVDDLGDHNPASHRQLFAELVEHFVASAFDLRDLLRTLANTQAYQLSSQTGEEGSGVLFSRMNVKALTGEQLYDSIMCASLRSTAAQQGGQIRMLDARRSAFVARMQSQARQPTEFQAGPPQALMLMNGPEMAEATDPQQSGLVAALDGPLFSDSQCIDVMFLATLSRFPTGEERQEFVEHVQSGAAGPDRRKALSDVLWALLNSAEFALNH